MAFIKALSYYLPEDVVTNEQLGQELDEPKIDALSKQAGIRVRHVAAPGQTATDMAVEAARKLFSQYGIHPSEIGFVLYCTQCSDYQIPSSSCIIQDKLGIPVSAGAVTIDSGCSGFVYGLAIANSLIEAGVADNVLFLTSDTSSKNLLPTDKNRMLFGDAAAATLIAKDGIAEIGKFVLGTDGSGYDKLIIKNGGSRHKVKDGSDGDYVYMDGEAIFNFTMARVPPMITQVLARNGMSQDGIDYYVFHQPNKFMLTMLRKICGIPKEKFYINLEETGNTTSSSVPVGLADCIADGTIHPGMNVMISGFGVGLSWAGTILKF